MQIRVKIQNVGYVLEHINDIYFDVLIHKMLL